MLATEWKLEDALDVRWEEGMEEGMEKGIKKGMKRGMEKGLEKGMEKGIKKSALAMIAEGLPLELIKKVTKLPDEDVQRLMECGQ